jgi:isoleucyl-tRNA synthetase
MKKRPEFFKGDLNLPKLEEEVLKFWDERKIFEKSLQATEDGKAFSFYDGPPFATGLPHYGHILASTIKDLVPRYQTMQGRFVRRRWGWDCHGLPIEEIVERKLGISGKKQIEEVGIKKFNETCRSMVLGYVSEWRAMIRRIARWVDFDDSYKTMDSTYMESVWWGFKQIYDKGLIYEGRKVLLYCPRCETPVSNFEVAMDNSYKEVQEESVFIKFKVKHPEKINLSGNVYLLAWTTTPWTLPGNVALAVGRDIKYRAIHSGNDYLIVAIDRLHDLDLVDHAAAIDLTGTNLVGLEYEPLFDIPAMSSEKAYKVYPADFVTTTDGTGIVHTAVVYGEDDYALGIREGLPVVPLLDEKGHFNDKAPELVRGSYFKGAEKFIKEDLESRGLLFRRQQYTHPYPFCWRCGTALYYNAIPAWFVNVQKIKPELLKSNNAQINWYPDHLKHGRYEKSVEAAPDWNISRNRYWGNPIPAWKCTKCQYVEIVGSLDELSVKVGGTGNKYWVMRHGEAESNIFDIMDSGQRKYLHLTPRGRKQVEASIKKFVKKLEKSGEKIDLIISSDITRTKETEEIDVSVLLGMGVKVSLDKRIEEIHLGPTLTGRSDKKYLEMFPTYESRFEERPEGGESVSDVRKRVWEFLAECEEKHKGKNILIVSHEDPIWAMFQAAEGWSQRQTIAAKTENKGGFIGFAEIRELHVKNIPRNDTGEVDMHRPYIDEVTFPCGKCADGMMIRTPEIFDSWVEAGSMPFAEHHYPFENKAEFERHFPAQFVAEYIAQTRAWFYVMHVISTVLFDKAPFENVVTTGTILAEDGSKMSKSKANFPDPKLLIEKFGADSLRFYLMNSVVMQADNLNFSEKGVESVYRKVGMLISNVYKYFATYQAEEGAAPSSSAQTLDAWITTRTEQLVQEVTERIDSYDTVRATRAIQEYVDDLSTWYLRRNRRRKDLGFFKTMRESLLTTSKVLAPFMPFLAEALYVQLAGKDDTESVHLATWPEVIYSLNEADRKESLDGMVEIRRLASLGLAKRAEAKIKVRQPLAAMKVKGDGGVTASASLSKDLLAILADEVNVKTIVFDTEIKNEVELDTVITPELREEGAFRDIARMVQELRQKAALEPKDMVAVMLQLPAEAQGAIEKREAAFKNDIGAKIVEYKRSDKFDAEEETKIDGQAVWIGLRKI